MKPIAMRCALEQFNDIKQELVDNGLTLSDITTFSDSDTQILVNNRYGKLGLVTNYVHRRDVAQDCGRQYFDYWDKDIFLEHCGIKVEPKFKPIAMRCNQEQFDSIKQILVDNDCTSINIISRISEYSYLVNNADGKPKDITNVSRYRAVNNYNRTVFEEWDANLFLESCGIKTENKTQTKPENKMKTTITATELLEIHSIACSEWKEKIKTEYFVRIKEDQTIDFTRAEISSMLRAATKIQKPVLEKIFGKQVKNIEWDRIRTGSKVMIEYTGEHCGGFDELDIDKPVDVVFYRTPQYITNSHRFSNIGHYTAYCTFHQDGKYALFSADTDINYITEVVEY